jgi:hypothetical protein
MVLVVGGGSFAVWLAGSVVEDAPDPGLAISTTSGLVWHGGDEAITSGGVEPAIRTESTSELAMDSAGSTSASTADSAGPDDSPILDVGAALGPEIVRLPLPPSVPRHGTRTCGLARDRAARGSAEKDWLAVVAASTRRECWAPAEREGWRRLRVMALAELGRFEECARVGRQAKDPKVRKQAEVCESRVKR